MHTLYNEFNAPSVAIPKDLHQRLVSARLTSEHRFIGGRKGGMDYVTKDEFLELYKQVYTWHTPFRELYEIAKKILRKY